MYLISDLDGTFLTNDFFLERFKKGILKNPFLILKVLKSRQLVSVKHQLLDSFFPSKKNIEMKINTAVLTLLQQEKETFDKCLLISASTQKFLNNLRKQSGKFEIFDQVYGTEHINLKGQNKLDFILKKNFTPYVYLGDSKSDEILFQNSSYYYKMTHGHPVKCFPNTDIDL